MQADRGFIQDIAYARQSSSHAGCQADSLQFATAEGLTRTIQREISQTDLIEVGQAGEDFLKDRLGDLLPLGVPA